LPFLIYKGAAEALPEPLRCGWGDGWQYHLGGGIGWAVDSASRADNKYESPVNITLGEEIVTKPTSNLTSFTRQPDLDDLLKEI
jgi:hypothetical protein